MTLDEIKKLDIKSIAAFLKTDISKEELASALKVLQAFKKCETGAEWMATPFAAWAKLEQLEEYLEFLVNGKALASDTLKHLEGK